MPDITTFSPMAIPDGVFVVAATAQIRKWLPKIDGWWAVALVVALALGAGLKHAGARTGTVMEYLTTIGTHTAAVLVVAFGGMEALRSRIAKALTTGLPPSIPPPPGAVLVLFLALAPVVSGCGPSLLNTAATVANAEAEALEVAQPILQERCITPMVQAAERNDVAAARAIADRCDAPIAAFDLARRTHIALRAAVVAIASGHIPPNALELVADVVEATAALASSIGDMR